MVKKNLGFEEVGGHPMCPGCGINIKIDHNLFTENDKHLEVNNLGVLMIVKCKKCKNEFIYFRPMKMQDDINKAILIAKENIMKGMVGNRGVQVGTLMLAGFVGLNMTDEEMKEFKERKHKGG